MVTRRCGRSQFSSSKTFTEEKVGGGRPKSTRGRETTQIQPKRRGEEGCEDEDVKML